MDKTETVILCVCVTMSQEDMFLSHVSLCVIVVNLITNYFCIVTRLRAFEYDPKYTDPRLIANKDSQQFNVIQILKHSGDRYGSKNQQYL